MNNNKIQEVKDFSYNTIDFNSRDYGKYSKLNNNQHKIYNNLSNFNNSNPFISNDSKDLSVCNHLENNYRFNRNFYETKYNAENIINREEASNLIQQTRNLIEKSNLSKHNSIELINEKNKENYNREILDKNKKENSYTLNNKYPESSNRINKDDKYDENSSVLNRYNKYNFYYDKIPNKIDSEKEDFSQYNSDRFYNKDYDLKNKIDGYANENIKNQINKISDDNKNYTNYESNLERNSNKNTLDYYNDSISTNTNIRYNNTINTDNENNINIHDYKSLNNTYLKSYPENINEKNENIFDISKYEFIKKELYIKEEEIRLLNLEIKRVYREKEEYYKSLELEKNKNSDYEYEITKFKNVNQDLKNLKNKMENLTIEYKYMVELFEKSEIVREDQNKFIKSLQIELEITKEKIIEKNIRNNNSRINYMTNKSEKYEESKGNLKTEEDDISNIKNSLENPFLNNQLSENSNKKKVKKSKSKVKKKKSLSISKGKKFILKNDEIINKNDKISVISKLSNNKSSSNISKIGMNGNNVKILKKNSKNMEVIRREVSKNRSNK